MTKRELGSLAFKLAGIYVLVQATMSVFALGYMLMSFPRQPEALGGHVWQIGLAFSVFPAVVLPILGAVLIRYSTTFAVWTFADPEAPATAIATVTDLQAALLAVIGVSLIAAAVPQVASSVGLYVYWEIAPPIAAAFQPLFGPHWGFGLAESSGKVLIGVALILCRRGATNGWDTIRGAWRTLRGRREDVEDELPA